MANVQIVEAQIDNDGNISARVRKDFSVRYNNEHEENERGEKIYEYPQHQFTAEVIFDSLSLEEILGDAVSKDIINRQRALRDLGADKLEAYAERNGVDKFHHEDAGKKPQFTTPEERRKAAEKATENMTPEELEQFIREKQKELAG